MKSHTKIEKKKIIYIIYAPSNVWVVQIKESSQFRLTSFIPKPNNPWQMLNIISRLESQWLDMNFSWHPYKDTTSIQRYDFLVQILCVCVFLICTYVPGVFKFWIEAYSLRKLVMSSHLSDRSMRAEMLTWVGAKRMQW